MKQLIVIDNEVLEVTDIYNTGYGKTLSCDGSEYILFKHRDHAVNSVIDYYTNMVNNEPDEFTYLVGIDCLTQWALGRCAGPGYITATNLIEWIEAIAEYPEEVWASYDGIEIDSIRFNKHFARALNICDTDSPVIYRVA